MAKSKEQVTGQNADEALQSPPQSTEPEPASIQTSPQQSSPITLPRQRKCWSLPWIKNTSPKSTESPPLGHKRKSDSISEDESDTSEGQTERKMARPRRKSSTAESKTGTSNEVETGLRAGDGSEGDGAKSGKKNE